MGWRSEIEVTTTVDLCDYDDDIMEQSPRLVKERCYFCESDKWYENFISEKKTKMSPLLVPIKDMREGVDRLNERGDAKFVEVAQWL